ncbi:hypothetical protein L3Q82_018865, partial [Scortum barcoo]
QTAAPLPTQAVEAQHGPPGYHASFYRCTTESIPPGFITTWYGSCTALNRKAEALQRVHK